MSQSKEVHLVILIHGLWGSPAHLANAKQELEEAYHALNPTTKDTRTKVTGPNDDPVVESTTSGGDEELVIVIAGGMTSQLTYDGIDVCASRVAWEVDQEVEKLEKDGKKVTRFSVTGYSLGGLSSGSSILGRTASFKNTIILRDSSPRLILHDRNSRIPRYNTFLSTSLVWLGSKLLSRSGEQLYVTDRYSDQDTRPLLEIMADPNQIFSQGLEQFDRLRIYGNAIKDDTVPYPSSAIDTTDHFTEWQEQGIEVSSDSDGIMTSWSRNEELRRPVKKGWASKLGNLPPVLKYRFPYNYIIMLLMPVMVPLIMVLIISRSLLDTRRSQARLQKLAQTSLPIPSESGTSTPIPSALGLSITSLRQVIRRVERSIESDIIDSSDPPDDPIQVFDKKEKHLTNGITEDAGPALKVFLKDSQLRMAIWLNNLPWVKVLTWYPEITNSHAVIIVRDPTGFPVHNRGRGLLKRWAKGVLGVEDK